MTLIPNVRRETEFTRLRRLAERVANLDLSSTTLISELESLKVSAANALTLDKPGRGANMKFAHEQSAKVRKQAAEEFNRQVYSIILDHKGRAVKSREIIAELMNFDGYRSASGANWTGAKILRIVRMFEGK